MAVVNAFLMYQEIGHDSIFLFEFKRSLALGLLIYSQKCRLTQSKNRGIKYSVPDTVRLSNFGIHWVEFVESRGRCQVCSVNKKNQDHNQSVHIVMPIFAAMLIKTVSKHSTRNKILIN